MKATIRQASIALAAALAVVPAAWAHHSTAIFDASRTFTLAGTVTVFQWTNPHAWLWIQTPSPDHTVKKYGFEMGALSMLRRQGWSRTEFNPGDSVTITYHPFKDGEPGGQFIDARFANGDTLNHRGAGKVPAGTPPSSPTPPPK